MPLSAIITAAAVVKEVAACRLLLLLLMLLVLLLLLQDEGLATMQDFNMTPSTPLPPALLPYLRLAYATTHEDMEKAR